MKRKGYTQKEQIDMIMKSMKTWDKDNSPKSWNKGNNSKYGSNYQSLTPYAMLLIANLAILISVLFLR